MHQYAAGIVLVVALWPHPTRSDDLPPGAVARLGTTRQRAPGAQVALTADGKEIVSAGRELTVRRFDARTGELLGARQLPRRPASNAWLSPRGRYLLADGLDAGQTVLELWDLARGERARSFAVGPNMPWWSASFSSDERRVAIPLSDPTQRNHQMVVWDVATGRARVLWTLNELFKARYVDPSAFLSPDGRHLLACHLDRVLRCWDVDKETLLWEKPNHQHRYLLFTPDGKEFLGDWTGRDRKLDFLAVATGETRSGPVRLPDDARYPVRFSDDGRYLACEDGQDGVVVWDREANQVASRLPPSSARAGVGIRVVSRLPGTLTFNLEGTELVRRSGVLQRWDVRSGKALFPDSAELGHTDAATRLVFAPDGRTLASRGDDQTVRLWDIASQRARTVPLAGATGMLAFTPDGSSLVAAPTDQPIAEILRLWNTASASPVRSFPRPDAGGVGGSNRDHQVTVAPDGRVLAQTMKNGRRNDECLLTVWDLATGKDVVHKRVPWDEECPLSADGRLVLAFDRIGARFRLVDVATEEARVEFENDRTSDPQERVWDHASALSPDGRWVAFRVRLQRWPGPNQAPDYPHYDDLRIGDARTGKIVEKIPASGGAVFAFTRDGRVFGVADHRSLRLWETATWKPIGGRNAFNQESLPVGEPFAAALAFAPDGRTLATGHADGTIVLWDATLRGKAAPAAELDALWRDLGGDDAGRAYAAVWSLADDTARSIPFLLERLAPGAGPPSERLRRLLTDLDSDRFGTRQAAEKELRSLGARALGPLQAALQGRLSLEGKRRVQTLLKALNQPGPESADEVRAWRAVWALEQAGTPSAHDLLARLAAGAEWAWLARLADESRARSSPR